jgi:dTDP-4-dehydrorhamnose reductase
MVSDSKRTRILLFGANGQVGYELVKSLKPLGLLNSVVRAEANFGDPERLRIAVRNFKPDIVVNAAAYTAVDKAEAEPELAFAVNAQAPGVLAEEAEAVDACLVHYSTDYVFDGKSAQPYGEDSPVNPLSVYGCSKLAGDLAVIKACRRHLIFRTSWVFGVHGTNFLKTMLRVAKEQTSMRIVADQIGAPTSAGLIAKSTANVLAVMQTAPATDARWGIYHLTAKGETSWHGFARYVIEMASVAEGTKLKVSPEDICPISTAGYPLPAARPANSMLDTRKIRETFGLDFPDWRYGVDQVLTALMS